MSVEHSTIEQPRTPFTKLVEQALTHEAEAAMTRLEQAAQNLPPSERYVILAKAVADIQTVLNLGIHLITADLQSQEARAALYAIMMAALTGHVEPPSTKD